MSDEAAPSVRHRNLRGASRGAVRIILATLVAIGLILSFFHKLAPGDRFSALSLGLILAGAVGNLLDRIRFGEVVDFLHFRLWGGYSWPEFNLADSFIVVGVMLLVIELLATESERPNTTRGVTKMLPFTPASTTSKARPLISAPARAPNSASITSAAASCEPAMRANGSTFRKAALTSR